MCQPTGDPSVQSGAAVPLICSSYLRMLGTDLPCHEESESLNAGLRPTSPPKQVRSPPSSGRSRPQSMSMPAQATFSDWVDGRDISTFGTNSGATPLPFQQWRHFKESFAPELVERAIQESSIPVKRAFDPFGGSGTTALACQFLGVHPITCEVNPYLADLIEAKVRQYDTDNLVADMTKVIRSAVKSRGKFQLELPKDAPQTLVEPGKGNRWVFDEEVAARVASLRRAIRQLDNSAHKMLFRVLLGGILIEVSNVVVNGKGRRYRGQWRERSRLPNNVDRLFAARAQAAVTDIHRFRGRPCRTYELHRSDAKKMTMGESVDLVVCSPPYPNSFDYTDVYNVELWVLDYLASSEANRSLRQSTIASHVQIHREYAPPPQESSLLGEVVETLRSKRGELWNRYIPDMIGGYFADLKAVLSRLTSGTNAGGQIWFVVGDSRYSGVHVPVAKILADIAPRELQLLKTQPFRSMRASAQQGGRYHLAETLVAFQRL